MLGLRRAACEVLGRGVRSGSDLLSSGRQLARYQPWIGEKACLPTASTGLVQVARTYARRIRELSSSHLDDLPPATLKIEYNGVQKVEEVNDVVKRLLSLSMASQSDKLKVKIRQLVDKVSSGKSPEDKSPEVRIAVQTAKIHNYKEHMELHPKDKANKRRMLMTIDRRKKLLKNLRRTHFEMFEHVCQQLGIVYTPPPEYRRRVTKRWLAKKALCLRVFEEVKKQKAAGLLRVMRPRRSRAMPKSEKA